MTDGRVIVAKPPDGGYGWIIVFSAFMTSFILDGISFSFGIFYKEFLQYFNDTNAKTAWIGSVYNGSYLLLGPFVSMLCSQFGCRKVAMVGGVVACVSCVLAMLCDSVDLLILTYGFLGGTGFGMMYLPALVMVGYYFEDNRALATGIAVCGTGVGALVFSKLSEYLINEFAWRGATLIIAGIALNGTVFGALLKPLEAEVIVQEEGNGIEFKKPVEEQEESEEKKENGPEASDALIGSKLPKRYRKKKDNEAAGKSAFLSLQNFLSGSEEKVDMYFTSTHRLPSQVKVIDVSRPKTRKDTFYIGSVDKLEQELTAKPPPSLYPKVVERPHHHSVIHLVTNVEAVEKLVAEDKVSFMDSVKAYLRSCVAELEVIKQHPDMVIYGFSCIACMLGFYVPFTYLPYAIKNLDLGDSAASNLLMVIAGSNLVSRVVGGFVGDRKGVDCVYFNLVCLLLGGIGTLFFSHLKSMVLLVAACVVFGNSIAIFVALRSVIAVQILGIEQLSSGIGYVLFCQGISSLVGTPLAGLLSDSTGSLDITFYYAGAALIFSALLCLPVKLLTKWKQAKTARRNNEA